MLVAGTAISLISPIAAQASETLNLDGIGSYERSGSKAKRFDSNTFINEVNDDIATIKSRIDGLEVKQNVLEANKNIFNSVDTISVNLNELYIDDNVATCIIEIVINNEETLKVIDIIKIDTDGKIKEISAYKQ